MRRRITTPMAARAGLPRQAARAAGNRLLPSVCCATYLLRMANINAQIAKLSDMLTGNRRTDAQLRFQISNLKRSLTNLKNTAQNSGCALP